MAGDMYFLGDGGIYPVAVSIILHLTCIHSLYLVICSVGLARRCAGVMTVISIHWCDVGDLIGGGSPGDRQTLDKSQLTWSDTLPEVIRRRPSERWTSGQAFEPATLGISNSSNRLPRLI